MAGSGLFVNKKGVLPHLLVSHGTLKEVDDLRNDVAAEMLPMAAVTVQEFTNAHAAVTNGIVTSHASAITVLTLSGAGLNGAIGAAALSPPRNITITTSDHVATWQGNTVIHGKDEYGNVVTDTLAMANNTTIVGVVPFASVTSVVMDIQVDALGSFTVGYGLGIGVHYKPKSRAGGVTLLREVIDGALVTTGALTAVGAVGLYTPATAPDGAHDWAVWYEYDVTAIKDP